MGSTVVSSWRTDGAIHTQSARPRAVQLARRAPVRSVLSDNGRYTVQRGTEKVSCSVPKGEGELLGVTKYSDNMHAFGWVRVWLR